MAYVDDFKILGPYTRKDGRKIVIVVDKNGHKRTVSYPKWLMEVHLGRQLDKNFETIDHVDNNIDNNDLSNLRIMPRKEHSTEDTRRVKLIKLECAWCKKPFERSPRLLRDKAKNKVSGVFCSRRCAGIYSRKLQLKEIAKFPVQPHVESEYYRKKNLCALAVYFIYKYGL